MLRRFCLTLAAIAALGGTALTVSAPAAAQGFSVTIGGGQSGYDPAYGPDPYAPQRHYRPVGPPQGYYGRPAYGYDQGYYAPRPRRCWNRPVDVWNGWGYERRLERVCR
mgnify:CR=1 FL=1